METTNHSNPFNPIKMSQTQRKQEIQTHFIP